MQYTALTNKADIIHHLQIRQPSLLARAVRIEPQLDDGLKRMVGFRNLAVHDYQKLQLPIVVSIITQNLDEFLQYRKVLLSRG